MGIKEAGLSCAPQCDLCTSILPLRPPPTRAVTTTMVASAAFRGLLFAGLLTVVCRGQASQEATVEDFGGDKAEPSADRDLLEALEVVLGRIHSQVSSPEKRGNIPLCGLGDRCAMRFGPRIGKLCDCARGYSCNSYLLKCI